MRQGVGSRANAVRARSHNFTCRRSGHHKGPLLCRWSSAFWAFKALPREEELSGVRRHLQSVNEILLKQNISARRTFNVTEKVSLCGAIICASKETHLQPGTACACKATPSEWDIWCDAGAMQLMRRCFCSWFPVYAHLAPREYLFFSLVCEPGVKSMRALSLTSGRALLFCEREAAERVVLGLPSKERLPRASLPAFLRWPGLPMSHPLPFAPAARMQPLLFLS